MVSRGRSSQETLDGSARHTHGHGVAGGRARYLKGKTGRTSRRMQGDQQEVGETVRDFVEVKYWFIQSRSRARCRRDSQGEM